MRLYARVLVLMLTTSSHSSFPTLNSPVGSPQAQLHIYWLLTTNWLLEQESEFDHYGMGDVGTIRVEVLQVVFTESRCPVYVVPGLSIDPQHKRSKITGARGILYEGLLCLPKHVLETDQL